MLSQAKPFSRPVFVSTINSCETLLYCSWKGCTMFNTRYRYKYGFVLCFFVFNLIFFTRQHVSAEDMDRVQNSLKLIPSFRFGDSRAALTEVETFIRSTNDIEKRAWLENEFVRILNSDVTYDCIDFICRQLRVIGTDISIPVLEKLLLDNKTSDMACYALLPNSSPAAGKALRDALKKTTGKARIGIIYSLGERKDHECVDELVSLIFDESTKPAPDDAKPEEMEACKIAVETAIASIRALASIGGKQAGHALSRAKVHENQAVRTAASPAFLKWADTMVQNDNGE